MDRKLVITLIFSVLISPLTSLRLDEKLTETIKYAEEKYHIVLNQDPTANGRFPHTGKPESQTWDDTTTFGGWTAGFYPGVLWQLYRLTQNTEWAVRATVSQEALAQRQHDTGTHDVGFVIMSSFGLGFKSGFALAEWKDIIVQTARSLSTRFVEVAGVLRSWNSDNDEVTVIVDNMMNLDLLYTAEELSGDSSFSEIANTHAQNTIKNHYRPDDSSFHVVAYSENDGRVTRKYTAQGYLDNSTWARGHAWGILGYIESYQWTNKTEYLDIAERAADYFIQHLPTDSMPYWDFDAGLLAGSSYQPRDTSAASIAAYGFLNLYVTTGNSKYLESSELMIECLIDNYNTKNVQIPAISMNGTVHRRNNQLDTAIIYGDFYLLKYIELYLRLD